MKKLIVVVFVVLCSSILLGDDNSAIVGKWDCEAIVDMTYPFDMDLADKEGVLSGAVSSDMGSMDLANVSYSDGTLKFELDIPEAGGIIYYDAKDEGKTIKGSLGNDMFEGDLSCVRPE